MDKPFDQEKEKLRQGVIGLGDNSFKKSYYPQLQKKLNELDRFKALIDYTSDYIFCARIPDGQIVDINKSVCLLFDLDRDVALEKRLEDFIDFGEDSGIAEIFSLPELPDTFVKTADAFMRISEDVRLSVELTCSLARFPKEAYVIIVARDITERKMAERVLLQNADTVNNIPIGMQVFQLENPDDDGSLVVVSANPASAELTEIPADDMIGKRIDDIFPCVCSLGIPAQLAKIAKDGGRLKLEDVVFQQDPEKIVFTLDVFSLPGQQVGVAYEDVSKRIKAEDNIREALVREQEANRLKSSFLAVMSHEIRTPLNAVLGFTDLICTEPLSTTQQEYLGIVKENGTMLLDIINDILDMSLIETGQLEIAPVPVFLEELFGAVFKHTMDRLEQVSKDIVVDWKIGDEVAKVVMVDPGRLRQIFLNLVNNAVKFTNEGSIDLSANVKEGRLVFCVADTGIGIPRELHNKAFEPFTQLDMSGTRKHGGTGLGLTITRKILSIMQGRIWMETPQEGKGTKVFFDLPYEPVEDIS